MFNKLKQFKDLKDRAKNIQSLLGKESAEGSAGWGKVKVTINGNQEIQSVTIDPSVMGDKAKLESLIREAGNDAIKKIQQIMSAKIKEAGGLDIAAEFGDALKK